MLVTTLNARLLESYGRDTVATWSRFTQQEIVVLVSPDEQSLFAEVLGPQYKVLSFSEASLQRIEAIAAKEAALDVRRDDYRFQAARFSWKVFAVAEAFDAFPDAPALTWLDADSLLKPGIDAWLTQLFAGDDAVYFLGRAHKQIHAETGLIHFRGPLGQALFRRVLEEYVSLGLFDHKEWHDAYIYTAVFQFRRGCADLSQQHHVRSSNPIFELDRGRHLLHLKGGRKGSSSAWLDHLRVWLGR
jgi:hypothetical protein